ncbi:MAG: circumsporozoite protein-membrane associated protein, partial [Planctomycetota bacterium]
PVVDQSGSSRGGLGRGGWGCGVGERDACVLPESTDLDYTRKATDLVLDYLDQTRENPDPDLLDQLKWDPKDLQAFRERWRDLVPSKNDAANEAIKPDVEEALKSLGMRPQTPGQTQRMRGEGDGLGGIRDSGNRRSAPSTIRDAFEAFQRFGAGQR